jgi:hypothetical protein
VYWGGDALDQSYDANHATTPGLGIGPGSPNVRAAMVGGWDGGGDQHAAALASRERSRRRRRAAGMGEITTEIGPAGPFSCAGG